MSNLKIVIKDGDVMTAEITVDGKVLCCESIDIQIRPDGCKATVVIYDLDLHYEGKADVVKILPQSS